MQESWYWIECVINNVVSVLFFERMCRNGIYMFGIFPYNKNRWLRSKVKFMSERQQGGYSSQIIEKPELENG